MHEAAVVGGDERLGDLQGDRDDQRRRQRAVALHALFQRLALDEFHRVKALAAGRLAEVINAGHVRMAQLRGGARLAPETLPCGRVGGKLRADDLEGDRRIEIDVARLVSDAHRAPAQLAKAAVLAQLDFVVVKRPGERSRRRRRQRGWQWLRNGIRCVVAGQPAAQQTNQAIAIGAQRLAAHHAIHTGLRERFLHGAGSVEV